jgi:hypothetical protein
MRQVPLEQQIAWSMENAKKEERSSVEEKTAEVKAQIQAEASSTQEEE